MKIGRNAPCPCDSGAKYKKCCLRKRHVEWRDGPLPEPPTPEEERAARRAARLIPMVMLAVGGWNV
jgi:uncharacterized protein YchJ